MNPDAHHKPQNARTRFLEAACSLIRQRGFAATSIEDLCRAAGATKGAFFYHFESKERLGVEAARYWSNTTGELFANADYHQLSDPLDRVLAYIDLRAVLIDGSIEEFTCLVGTMVQETFATSDNIRLACGASMVGHADTLVVDIAAAIEQYPPKTPVSAEGLAQFVQTVMQGGFILAKAKNDPEAAKEAVGHLRDYFRLLFTPPT